MNIVAIPDEFALNGRAGWIAYDDNAYDSPGSIFGRGLTREEAIADLIEQIEDNEGR